MDDQSDWVDQLESNLQNEDLRMETLTEIRNRLASSSNQASQTVNSLRLPLLFDCLNDSNSEQIDLACEVLTLCMSNLSVGETTNRYSDSLERALRHPSPGVKLMALKEIERYTANDESIQQICNQNSIILGLLFCIGSEDLSVAIKAGEIVSAIGKSEYGLSQILQPKYLEHINAGLQREDEIRFRLYEVVTKIACVSPTSLQAMIGFGWIVALINELRNNDFLVQLNALELLSNLAATAHGRTYIENENIPVILAKQLEKIREDPLASLLLPGLIKFFGNLAFWQPMEVFNSYQEFVHYLFDPVNLNDPSLFAVTIDTIGLIGSTVSGKRVLFSQGQNMQSIVLKLGELMQSLPVDKRIRVINCLESLIRIAPDEQNEIVLDITQNWFKSLCQNPIDLIVRYIKTPFPDVSLASLQLLHAVAQQIWGQCLIFQTPGLVEYLLDRGVSHSKEAKEIKYEIVKELRSNAAQFLNEAEVDRIQQFIKQGPFYGNIETLVAVEGN